jgi:hypothetical protein
MNLTHLPVSALRPRWHPLAPCRNHPELDWIDAPPDSPEEQRCKTICRACPVRTACLASAMGNREPWGVWGGLNTTERVAYAERTKRPVPNVLPPHGLNTRYAKHGCRCPSCRQAHRIYVRDQRRRSAQRAA